VRTLLFHKPYGVMSQFSPSDGKKTLADYIDVKGVYPAGRLDHDSEGLLLLTNDGALQHHLTDPKFGHPRTYWAQVERVPAESALQQLRTGLLLQAQSRTRPALARLLAAPPNLAPRDPPIRYRKSVPDAWIELTLTEGRNRQVRRMTAAVGHPTLRLVRWAIGELTLDGLRPGEWRDLSREELQALNNSSK
jgi:23S rRNA pseudouridine2457 synthase